MTKVRAFHARKLPHWADYPWRADGCKIFGFCEPPMGMPLQDPSEEWREVAHAETPEIAEVVAFAVNEAFRRSCAPEVGADGIPKSEGPLTVRRVRPAIGWPGRLRSPR
jgi:hypothetical protein